MVVILVLTTQRQTVTLRCSRIQDQFSREMYYSRRLLSEIEEIGDEQSIITG